MTANSRSPRILLALAAATGASLVGLPPLTAQTEDDARQSYSYVRSIEGRASLASLGNGPGEEADLNQILQRGDRIRVERAGRIEIALADRNLLRVAGGSDLALVQVAFSADGDDRSTRLDLDRGELVLEVTDEALGDELPEIRTPSARIFVNEPGSYRVRTESDGYTELVVRTGYAELLTERGSTIVRAGEEAWTSGEQWRPVELSAAGPRDALERWGDELLEAAQRANDRASYVEPELAYAAAPLADYGSWVSVDSSWYWRPRVSVGWRPYYDGRWSWSPSGLTWVSFEPWGWMPYHYGTWCDLPGYGWAWRPGSVYAPAWVYWYWSDSWTGWCPIGYYSGFYRDYWNSGFRFGVYGWTGGSWGHYSRWNFSPTGRVCERRRRGDGWQTGDHLGRDGGAGSPRGILTTDTSGLPRDRWDRPQELVQVLERQPRSGGRRELPVVTDFVARKPDLSPLVDAAVRPDPSERSGRLRGTPLDPGVARNGGAAVRPEVAAREPRPGWHGGPPDADGRQSGRAIDRRASEVAPHVRGGFEAPGREADPRSTRGAERSLEQGVGQSHAQGLNRATSRPGSELEAPSANDRQGWRRGDTVLGSSVRAMPAPGTRWQQPVGSAPVSPEARGRARVGDSGVADPRPQGSGIGVSSGSGRETSAPRTIEVTPGNSGRRYGYPAREIVGPDPSSPSGSSSSGGAGRSDRQPSHATQSAAPVERVIGGVRRSAPESGAPRGWSAPSSGGRTPPGAYPAPVTPRATSPGSSGYGVPRPAPTGQRATPPSSSASGGGRVSQSAGQQSGGQKATPPPQSSRSSSSSSSSSPPPKRRSRPADSD